MNTHLRVVVFFSGGASSLTYLLAEDPNLNERYSFVGAFTDNKTAPGIKLAEMAGIEVECLDFRDWCKMSGVAPDDLASRHKYFRLVSQWIARFRADVIMLSGFMLIVTDPLLSVYRGCILNVHPADLTIYQDGQRAYTGKNAVADAIRAGETSTRSTVHWVTEEVDGGDIVALSNPLPVEPDIDPARHQEKMKWACDGPAYAKALAIIASAMTTAKRQAPTYRI